MSHPPHLSRSGPRTPSPAPPRRLWSALAGLGLGALVLGPALGRGYVLVYDMVFVPDPPGGPAAYGLGGGFPRQVPSDAVVTWLAAALPADLVQKALLLAIFALGAWGAARLVPGRRALPPLAAALGYVWNPFVGERLLLGQWALLLGYAGLPWALAAVARQDGGFRLVRALIPAAVGGFAAMNVSALVVFSTALASPRRRRAVLVSAGALGGLALPWLVPGLLAAGQGRTDPAGVELFAARADTPFGALGSLLSLGGLWNAETVPPGYAAWPGAVARLLLALAAIAAFAVAIRRTRAGSCHAVGLRGLAGAAGAGLAVACLGLTGPGRAALRGLVGLWPGFGVLRDAQVYLAPLALLVAVGLGLLVAAALGPESAEPPRDRAGRTALAGVLLIAPVALLPGLGWGASGRLAAVRYPADWAAMRTIIDGDPAPGRVLALPWGAYRRYDWNDGRTVLDPLPRTLRRQVVWNDGLRVGTVALAPEAAQARRADALLRAPGPLTAALARDGYRYVVVERAGPPDASLAGRLAGARTVLSGPELTVYELPGTRSPTGGYGVADPIVLIADGFTLLLVLLAIAAPMRRSGHQGGRPPCAS